MSNGNQKTILRWNSDKCRWYAVLNLNGRPPLVTRAWVRVCKSCKQQKLFAHSSSCYDCKRHIWAEKAERSKQLRITAGKAHCAVALAIRNGDLADLRFTEVQCTDCDARAVCYDHRDYRKPLEVDPVCRSCNVRRGPASDVAHLVVRRFKKRASTNAQ